jgi:hypothetical protein
MSLYMTGSGGEKLFFQLSLHDRDVVANHCEHNITVVQSYVHD